MRSSVKKCPTIVRRRGVWRGLELSIKSLSLRRKEPEDENLPVFLCLFPTGASLLANGRANTKKKVCSQHTGSFLQGPLRRGGRECAARQGEHNPPAGKEWQPAPQPTPYPQKQAPQPHPETTGHAPPYEISSLSSPNH